MKYTIAGFRINLRQAFEKARSGEIVEIDRYGESFYLMFMQDEKSFNEEMEAKGSPLRMTHASVQSTPTGKNNLKNIREKWDKENPKINDLPLAKARIKNKDTPVRTEDEWQEAEGLELPCCKARKPCRHWAYDGVTGIWQNDLSGRQMEVQL